MKRSAILVAVVLAVCGAAVGQQKETFDIYGVLGYGFGIGGRDIGASETYTAPPGGYLTSKTDNYLNYGAGLKIEGGASYKLLQHLYGQAALCYSNGLFGIKKEDINVDDEVDHTTDQYSFSTLGIKVLLKPTFQIFDLFNAYTSFGIGLFFAFSSIDHTDVTNGWSAHADDNNWPALAFTGALGLEYPLNRNIILFGEVYCEEMGFMLHQRTVSKAPITNTPPSPWVNGTKTFETNSKDATIETPDNIPGSNAAIRVGVRIPLL
ncbi:MAG TPA: hypothetical protein VKF42_12190 [Chitinivibrionales bacterium]|nr:hypothetical protein [Chitinivibrionales bacterium]